jgi:flagellar motor protein MotB
MPKAARPTIKGCPNRRAEAVKRFLSEKYGIDASNLVTVGYGKTRLKNPSGPLSSENRRVQVINASDK